MNEWSVVTVIASLIALIIGVVTPIIKLNTSITRLTTVVDGLAKNFDTMTNKNSEAHDKLWEKVEEHGDTLNNHEIRLQLIENKK